MAGWPAGWLVCFLFMFFLFHFLLLVSEKEAQALNTKKTGAQRLNALLQWSPMTIEAEAAAVAVATSVFILCPFAC